MSAQQPKQFYVSVTWDDWPEGGSYGTRVMAADAEEASRLCLLEMAQSRAESHNCCRHCGDDDDYSTAGDGWDGFCPDCADRIENGETLEDTDAGAEKVLSKYSASWHIVDCFETQQAIEIWTQGAKP